MTDYYLKKKHLKKRVDREISGRKDLKLINNQKLSGTNGVVATMQETAET